MFPVHVCNLFYSYLFGDRVRAIFTGSQGENANATAVMQAVIVVSRFCSGPIAFAGSFRSVEPWPIVGDATTNSSRYIVFGNCLVFVGVLIFGVSPSPLAIVSVTRHANARH